MPPWPVPGSDCAPRWSPTSATTAGARGRRLAAGRRGRRLVGPAGPGGPHQPELRAPGRSRAHDPGPPRAARLPLAAPAALRGPLVAVPLVGRPRLPRVRGPDRRLAGGRRPQVSLAFEPGTLQIARGAGRLGRLFRRSSLVVCNREEAASLTGGHPGDRPGRLLDPMLALGPARVVITDGSAGAFGSDGIRARSPVPVFPDDGPVVDRTGAGDAFAGTLVAGLASGLAPRPALAAGPGQLDAGGPAGRIAGRTARRRHARGTAGRGPGRLRRAGLLARPPDAVWRRAPDRARPRRRPLRSCSVSRPPLLLLPPSEGKAAGGRRAGRPDSFADELAAPRAAVLAELGRVLRRRIRHDQGRGPGRAR